MISKLIFWLTALYTTFEYLSYKVAFTEVFSQIFASILSFEVDSSTLIGTSGRIFIIFPVTSGIPGIVTQIFRFFQATKFGLNWTSSLSQLVILTELELKTQETAGKSRYATPEKSLILFQASSRTIIFVL
ncbi:TPA: hypothetical protein DEG21_00305 [Patescibacteria group bacterium]|nr:hypothetical protein [Candidatus Gracilibacteria bacterium]HBY74368.1 hypothetical protein [Candidatus Gracilibacteria bacterium]